MFVKTIKHFWLVIFLFGGAFMMHDGVQEAFVLVRWEFNNYPEFCGVVQIFWGWTEEIIRFGISDFCSTCIVKLPQNQPARVLVGISSFSLCVQEKDDNCGVNQALFHSILFKRCTIINNIVKTFMKEVPSTVSIRNKSNFDPLIVKQIVKETLFWVMSHDTFKYDAWSCFWNFWVSDCCNDTVIANVICKYWHSWKLMWKICEY